MQNFSIAWMDHIVLTLTDSLIRSPLIAERSETLFSFSRCLSWRCELEACERLCDDCRPLLSEFDDDDESSLSNADRRAEGASDCFDCFECFPALLRRLTGDLVLELVLRLPDLLCLLLRLVLLLCFERRSLRLPLEGLWLRDRDRDREPRRLLTWSLELARGLVSLLLWLWLRLVSLFRAFDFSSLFVPLRLVERE